MRTVISQRSLMNASISVSSRRAALDVDAHGVAGQEQVGGVAVELGALVGAERVLDGELVQAELAGELVELLLRRAAQVHPHDGVGVLEVLGDVGDREALGLENTLAVHPGHGIAHDGPPCSPVSLSSIHDGSLDCRNEPGCSGRGAIGSLDREVGSRADPISELRPGRSHPTVPVASPQGAHHRVPPRVGWCDGERPDAGPARPCRTEPGPIGYDSDAATSFGAIEDPPRRLSRHPQNTLRGPDAS